MRSRSSTATTTTQTRGGYWADLARRSPKVKVVILKDAGHTPWLDDAEGFHRSLETALSSRKKLRTRTVSEKP